MKFINKQTINFIWDMMFILIACNTISYLINKKNDKKGTVTIGILSTTIFVIIIALGIIVPKYMGFLLLGYEIIVWFVILDSIIVNKKNILIKLNKTEKIIIALTVLIGIIAVIFLSINTTFYRFEVKNNNICFNADTYRGIEQMISAKEVTHNIHPLYRFIVLPVMLPFIIINEILKGHVDIYYLETVSVYVICFMQIICNAICTLLIYRILTNEKLQKNIVIIGTLIFTFSLSIIWTSILPETYAITITSLLMFIYLYQKRNIFTIVSGLFAIGSNIMAIVPVGLILLVEIIKNIKKIKKYIPLIIINITLVGIIIIPYLWNYVNKWIYSHKSITETLTNSINYFLIPLLFGPNFTRNIFYLVQTNTFEPVVFSILGVCMIFAIIGYITNYKKVLANISMIFLIIGYTLHILIGYGFANGIIYSPLYCWAFVLLIAYGINCIYEKTHKKKITITILIILILYMIIHNTTWTIKISNNLKNQTLDIPQGSGLYKYLNNGDHYEAFYIRNCSLYRCSDGKEILNNIDHIIIYENNIVGLLRDSNWFNLHYENNELKLNISNKIQTIEKDYFYIFGMGLRNKFILTKGNNDKYKLIQYDDEKEILTDLVIDEIDYENYTIYFKDDIIIYENEYGIYIEKNGQLQILDESTYIKIPEFEGYEHKDQLKILFNEIMINITDEGPKPNFIAYDEVWYGDACIVAKVLQETDNMEQIDNWLNNINKIYDENNGVKEADNLGQVLYLISLSQNRNQNIIDEILHEAKKLRTEEGYIVGITDSAEHPVYQTKWLIYGMESLGLDSSQYKVPEIEDSYSNLLWFDNINETKKAKMSDRWQYLYYANIHYNKDRIDYKNTTYPISNEILPSMANYKNMEILNDDLAEAYVIAPHSWSASEMFLYLLDLDRGNI